MAEQGLETPLTGLEEAMVVQVEVAGQLQVLSRCRDLFTQLARTWARIAHNDQLAYEDQVKVQVQVLREALTSIEQIHRTMGRSLRLLKWHQQHLSAPEDR